MPGRSEALERAQLAGRRRSLADLQDRFTASWFPGGEAFEEPVIRVHDAAHQWSNISPSPRGELQQSILDVAGTQRIYEDTKARGFVNSFPLGVNGFTADDFSDEVASDAIERLVIASRGLDHPLRGVPSQGSLPVNSPARLQVPPISKGEARELVKRGREFYGELGEEFNAKARPSMVRKADPDRVTSMQPFTPAPGMQERIGTNAQAQWIHENGESLELRGGYDAPGRMPYGPIEARLNRPLQYTVDEGILMREADKAFRQGLESDKAKVLARSPGIESGALQEQEKWLRRGGSSRYGLPDFVGSSPDVEPEAWFADHDRSIQAAIEAGAGKETSALQYVMRDRNDGSVLDVAARARDLTRVRDAVRTGFNATTDIAGSVPLFDPEFRRAVEQGRPGAAAGMVARDYAIGTAAAPVVGAGTGVLQRVAPGVAARVLPAVAGAARVGNPVAVVSQIGGDSRQTQAQVVAARQAGERQLNRARQARQRGGRWGFGPVRLPELGINESGGLFFGGNRSGRRIGTRDARTGKVWTGDSYGWQSPASARKIGVR